MKILRNLCLHFARQDEQDGKKQKEIHLATLTKIQKTKRRKYWMNEKKVTTQSMNNLSSPWGQLNASITKK